MATFTYKALDSAGREQSGQIEADTRGAAAGALRQQALFVVHMDIAGRAATDERPAKQINLRALLPIRLQDRVFFFQQMGLMLRSGLTVLQGLDVCLMLLRSPRMAAAVSRMRDRIKGGASLSHAMEQEQNLFPYLAIMLVQTAEVSGELDQVLDRIAEHLSHKAALRRNLITSLIYPGMVVIASFGVSIFLVLGVIPRFAEFFARSNKTLPPMTQNLIDVSNFIIAVGPYLIVLAIAAFAATVYTYRTERGRYALDRFIIVMPVVGAVITRAALAQITWAQAMLLRSGVTLLESLRVSAALVANRAIRGAFENAAEKILQGHELARCLRDPVIPPLVAELAAVGERTGTLEHVMQELGGYFDRELQASVKRMSAMIEPTLILVIGGMVGFVYYAFFQAVFSMAG